MKKIGGGGPGYTAGLPNEADGTITDNDGTPSVAVVATDASGAEQGSDPIVFTVTRTVNLFRQIVVTLAWSGTATLTTDYTVTVVGGTLSSNKLQLTLASGVDTATITLTPVDDSTVESTETAILTLSSGTGYVVGSPASATGSIVDNDTPAVATVVATDASGSEQGQDPIDFTRSPAHGEHDQAQLVFNLTWSGTATFAGNRLYRLGDRQRGSAVGERKPADAQLRRLLGAPAGHADRRHHRGVDRDRHPHARLGHGLHGREPVERHRVDHRQRHARRRDGGRQRRGRS